MSEKVFQHCNKTFRLSRNEQDILFIQEKNGFGDWVNLLHVFGSLEADCICALIADYDALQARVETLRDEANGLLEHRNKAIDEKLELINENESLRAACHTFELVSKDYSVDRVTELEAELAEKAAECAKAVDSIWECRVFLRGCMNHAFDETPIVEVAKDVSEEFHRNRYQIQCIAKERDNIARERDATNLLLKRLMCVVVPDNAVPNDMKEFVRDSAATVLKDLWDYLKTDADLRKAEHDGGRWFESSRPDHYYQPLTTRQKKPLDSP